MCVWWFHNDRLLKSSFLLAQEGGFFLFYMNEQNCKTLTLALDKKCFLKNL